MTPTEPTEEQGAEVVEEIVTETDTEIHQETVERDEPDRDDEPEP